MRKDTKELFKSFYFFPLQSIKLCQFYGIERHHKKAVSGTRTFVVQAHILITHTHKHFGFSACMERKLQTLFMCTVCLWKEANYLHLLLAKHFSKPHHFPSKKIFLLQFTFIPTDGVCWYFLSHLRGGKCGRKKEKWFTYGVT